MSTSQNVMALIRQRDSQVKWHGGWQTHRQFRLYVNGTPIRWYRDDDPTTGYASGKYLDRHMQSEIATLETALNCKCLNGKKKEVACIRST